MAYAHDFAFLHLKVQYTVLRNSIMGANSMAITMTFSFTIQRVPDSETGLAKYLAATDQAAQPHAQSDIGSMVRRVETKPLTPPRAERTDLTPEDKLMLLQTGRWPDFALKMGWTQDRAIEEALKLGYDFRGHTVKAVSAQRWYFKYRGG